MMNRVCLLLVAVMFLVCGCKKKKEGGVTRANKHMVLALDAAHGGSDTGSRTVDNGRLEKNLALDFCNKMVRIAPEYNIEVVLTRTGDKDMSVDERKAIASGINADAFISVHINRGTPVRPYEIFVVPGGVKEVESKALARIILRGLKNKGKDTLLTDRNVLTLTESQHPALAIECGDITVAADVAAMEHENELCRYLLSSLVTYGNSR